MLDKMFPKPGETEPEIRFEGLPTLGNSVSWGNISSWAAQVKRLRRLIKITTGGEKYPFSVLSTLREGILLIRPKRSQKKACAIVLHGLFWLAR